MPKSAKRQCLQVQAARVRKVSFVPPPDNHTATSLTYDPDTHSSCTVHGGTIVQQVWLQMP